MKTKSILILFGFSIAVLLMISPGIQAQKFEGLAQTPPMGWNSWNTFKTDINEELIRETAQAMIDSGMRDAGYNYVVLDDGWMALERDEKENLVAHQERFPNGMKALGDYLHEKGFMFGLYNCAGEMTCAGYPGSQGHEYQDALYYASVGVDYLKYDWCHTKTRDVREAYTTMSKALRKAGRPVVFSLCEWGTHEPWKWAHKIGHLWRTTGDITDCYDCTRQGASGWKVILDAQMDKEPGNAGLERYAGPGHWNDPDMLEVGNPGLTLAESRAHFSLWCILAAPLMAGNDVRNMSEEVISILTNAEAISIDQDPLGKQGWRFSQDDGQEIWLKELSGGDWAVCILNDKEIASNVSLYWDQLSEVIGEKEYTIRDIWDEMTLGDTGESPGMNRILDPHGVILLRLVPLESGF